MRIALITMGFSNDSNDWCTPALVEFVGNLTERVSVDVYTLVYPYTTRDYRAHGARVFSFGIGARGPIVNHLNRRRALVKLAGNHKKAPYDLIHAIWGTAPATVARKFSRRTGVPYITSLFAGETVCLPGLDYGGLCAPASRRRVKRNLEAAACVTAGSNFLAEITGRNLGLRPEVFPFGVNSDRFRPAGPKAELDGDFPILIAGSINRIKGHGMAIEAIRSLTGKRPGLANTIHLHIVGDEHDGGVLGSYLAGADLAFPCTVHGGRAYHDLPAVYRGAALCLIPSHFESQCMVALESAACGTPVLAAEVGIIPDIAGPGFTFKAGDEDALARNLEHIIDHPDCLGREAEAQRAKTLRLANLDQAVGRYLALYEKLASPA